MVLDLSIETGSMEKHGTAAVDKVESIVMSDDCIVAYSIKNPFEVECDLLDYHCWTATSMRELRMAVGQKNYYQLVSAFKFHWNMTTPAIMDDAEGGGL